jgi:hypothetical protein
MATKNRVPEPTMRSVKHQIFNKLCSAYLRFKNSAPVDADELRRELNLPETIFAKALLDFSVDNQMAVEVLQDKGRTYVRLGAGGRDLCADWNAEAKRNGLRTDEPPVDMPVQRLIRRRA